MQSQLGYSARNVDTPPQVQMRMYKNAGAALCQKTHVKAPTPPEEQKCVVYRDSCECGSVYVGETGRQMKTHIEDIKREL